MFFPAALTGVEAPSKNAPVPSASVWPRKAQREEWLF
jgi:hypothetical protein